MAAPPRRKRTLAGAEHELAVPPTRREWTPTYCHSARHGGRRGAVGIIYRQLGKAQAGARARARFWLGASQRNSGGVVFGGASPLCDGVKYKQGKWPRGYEGDGYPRAARPSQAWLRSRSELAVAEPGDDGWLGGWCAAAACESTPRGIDAVLNYFRELFAVYSGRQ
jgi:hypothetical protein